MSIAALSLLFIGATVLLMRAVISRFVCPFCGGPIRRAFEKMQCTRCNRLFYMWQARRR
jgi:hypothetical protein